VPSCRLAPEISNAEVARRFVEDELRREAVSEDTLFLAQLLTTELVTNAVRHAESPVEITVIRREDRIRIEARDDSTAVPALPADDPPIRYRGLLLVEDLAEEWGVEVEDRKGKIVWFEVLVT
jgi:anti-sigma regulatory factor (Ser/Thr protein kinase)